MHQSRKHDQASEIIAECMRRTDAGEVIIPENVLAEHPDLAHELSDYFDTERRLAACLGRQETHGQPLGKRATLVPGTGETMPAGGESFEKLPVEFGRYRVQQILGRGAMGAVYLAHDTKLGRDVALKTPKPDVFADSEMAERFEREACAAATLHHRNICPVFDVGEIDGLRFLTMAYIEGQQLSDFVSTEQPMSCRQAAVIVRKLALGLQEAHANGVIHRDLKPANVMIDKAREPVVMDFGLACRTENIDQSRLTGVGVLMGSPAYMSPEQVSGEPSAVTHATDIYSLGVILFELLTGRLPYQGSVLAIIGQIAGTAVPDVRDLRTDADPVLAEICTRLMAKSPEARFASMQQAANALAEYLQPSPRHRGTTQVSPVDVAAPVVSADVTAGESDSAIGRPRSATRRNTHNDRTRRQVRWTAAGVFGLLILTAIVIRFRDGTTITITDDTARNISLATNRNGTLKSLAVTSNPDIVVNKSQASDPSSTTAGTTTPLLNIDAAPTVIGDTITFPVAGGIQALTVSPDDRQLAIVNGTAPWQILVREVHTGLPTSSFVLPGAAGAGIRHLSYTPDGQSLFCCVGTHWCLVNTSDGSEHNEMDFPAPPEVVVFPQSPLALALYHEQEVHRTRRREVPQRLRIWNWQSGRIIYDENLPFERSPDNFPAVSHDERFLTYGREHCHVRRLLSIDGDDVTIGSAVTMEQTSRVRGPLVFSRNGKYAATSVKSKQAMAIVLNPESGRILTRIDPVAARTDNAGHQYGCSFAFTADSTQIVTADHTGLVTVWDTASGNRIRVLEQFRKSGNHQPPQVALTAAGDVIVAGGFVDPRVTIQRLEPK